jgi:hypothetical protein
MQVRVIAVRAITAALEAGGSMTGTAAPASPAAALPNLADMLLEAFGQPLPAAARRLAVRALGRAALSHAEREHVAAWARQSLARSGAAPDPDVLTLLALHLAQLPFLRLEGETPAILRRAAPA